MHPRLRSSALLLVTLSIGAAAPHAQTAAAPRPTLVAPAPKLTTPEQFFGHQIGDDYVLPNYTKFTEYVRRLDAESDRMIVQSIGKTAGGIRALRASPASGQPITFRTSAAYATYPEAFGWKPSV